MPKDLILAINPGTTTTRCALYAKSGKGLKCEVEETIDHDEAVIASFPTIASQFDFRLAAVGEFIVENMKEGDRIGAVAGRGGMLTPVPAGTIEVTPELAQFALHTPVYHHASNLGSALALAVAEHWDAKAFVVDPVSVDELSDVARISGVPELPRFSFVHALNIRACGRQLAKDKRKSFEDVRAVVAHLGAGISVAPLIGGRLVDSSNRMECSPFSPGRAGGVPPLTLIDMCFSGLHDRESLVSKLYGRGGVFAYLGTNDIRAVEEMIDEGNENAALVLDAMIYQIGKAIGAMAAVAEFKLDAIVLTGGLANSQHIVEGVSRAVSGIADVVVYPGSNECKALAEGAHRVMRGTEEAMTWPVLESVGSDIVEEQSGQVVEIAPSAA